MTSPPFLSICVPTRNRGVYLEHCLRTILAQPFTDYEVIVAENSDPSGREETRRVMEGLELDRIVYFEQDRVVSMTENYESALKRSRGTYCMCIGDDDGVVAGSLGVVAEILRSRSPEVLKSATASYFWPGSPWHSGTMLYLAVEGPSMRIDSGSALSKVAAFEAPYYILPMIYYSFVGRDVIERIIARQGSFFSDTTSIDVYSGMTIAAVTDSFMVSERPFAIAGQSPKSNGAAFMQKSESAITEEYKAQHDLEAQCARFKVPYCRSLDVITLMELSRAKLCFPDFLGNLSINRSECFRRYCGMVGEFSYLPKEGEKRFLALEEFRAADPGFDWQSALSMGDGDSTGDFYLPKGELYCHMATKEIGPNVVVCKDVYEASETIACLYDGKVISLPKKNGGRKKGLFPIIMEWVKRPARRLHIMEWVKRLARRLRIMKRVKRLARRLRIMKWVKRFARRLRIMK
jgi:glycosyltransferase involved in cell wall biosynthesis